MGWRQWKFKITSIKNHHVKSFEVSGEVFNLIFALARITATFIFYKHTLYKTYKMKNTGPLIQQSVFFGSI